MIETGECGVSRVLITFPGRTPRGDDGYRTSRCDFGEGSYVEPVAFFGRTLRRLSGRLLPESP